MTAAGALATLCGFVDGWESAMTRVDVLLVELGLAASRTAAQNLIAAGRVSCDGALVSKPSQKCAPGSRFDIAADPSDRFVSRGGLKMLGALGVVRPGPARRAGFGCGPVHWRF
ncbi:hypothetical protein JOS77_15445 [Chromobacterium haemolyticum]|nr:hypothetical protein JOS77_15445 [Chromobacterium haemolyticum]